MAHQPFLGIDFTDQRGGISGYAHGWFFWVHQGFKSALDIAYAERIDEKKTSVMRDKRAQRLGYGSLVEYRKSLKEQGILTRDDEEYQAIVKHAVRDSIEAQRMPPLCSFRNTDGLESRCGRWYVQVSQSTPDKLLGTSKNRRITSGSVRFQLFERSTSPDAPVLWEPLGWHACSQAEFAALLQHGTCAAMQLVAPIAECTPVTSEQVNQADLFG